MTNDHQIKQYYSLVTVPGVQLHPRIEPTPGIWKCWEHFMFSGSRKGRLTTYLPVSSFVVVRRKLFSQITSDSFATFTGRSSTSQNLRLGTLKDLFTQFDANHQQLVDQLCPSQHVYFSDNQYDRFVEEYQQIFCNISEDYDTKFSAVAQIPPPIGSVTPTLSSNIPLPKLPVPRFSGSFTDWPSFYDGFLQLIHDNNTLSNIQKFHFLKQALPEGRDQDVSHMALTDSGYTVAWDLLVKRYNNPRLHFMHTMAALYGLESVPKEAAEGIRRVLTLANVCISDLRRLKINIDSCDHWLVHHLLTKLPSSTTQAWEHSLGSSIVIPTFSMLETFLLERLVSIDLIENRNQPLGTRSTPGQSSHPRAPNRSTFNSTNRHSFHVTTNMGAPQCTLCQQNHVSGDAPVFSRRIALLGNVTKLDHLVQRFFELDSVPSERQLITEERWCKEHFRQTHVRQPNGKYMVRLPLKTLFDPSQVLGRSKHIALNRFHALERKLQHRDQLHQQYVQAIEEYFDLQQIQEVTTSEDSHSQSNTNGKLGVFCSTIPHHAVLKEDSLTTKLRVVYDASCKSSNGKSLNDILCTDPALQNDLGGVILNWRCYRYVFVADIQRMYRCIDMHPEDSQFQRIWWRDKTGELKEFRLTTVTFGTASAPYTAIRVIHQIAQDERENYPLAEKVLQREIYVDDVQSGHETTDGAIRVRNDVIAALRSAGMHLRKWAANHPALLSDIPEVDLCNHSIFEMDNKDSIKTLGLYWQPNPDVYGFKIHFAISPTLSNTTLVRLRLQQRDLDSIAHVLRWVGWKVELSGAVLAAKLATWIQQQLHVPQMRVTVHYWSDAMIVLHWIYGDPCRWKTFVANRIGSIQEVNSASQWGHVATQDNPADCATRGLTPLQLAQHKLWWNGPDWLQELRVHWPKVTPTYPDPSTLCEEQAAKVIHAHTSFINRFMHNARCKSEAPLSGPISVKEFSKAMFTLVRIVQQEAFSNELSKLRTNKSLPNSNKLSQLLPFIDAQGILRVRGRLRNALQLTTQERTPIILPKSHHFTDLVIKNAHLNTMHGGVQLTRAITQQQFWIINGKQAVKGVLRQCVACFQHRPKPSRQLMGDLPYHRVNPPNRAFEATGVDYTGAIEVKSSRFRGHTTYKAYIAVFICLASKAIHLELVTGLTAQHFLWALQRFIGRRGFVRHMYSDCGTNFIAADKSLHLWSNEFRQEINQIVVPELTQRYIQWHFNPPHSPNFGGLWEANVKAVKTHLHRSFKGYPMTYEHLSTVLISIEACLNSRPLCPLTADINDLTVLTPAHFLIGDSMQSLPTPSDKDKSLNTQFMEGQRILRQFWKRWSSDWLSHLQARPKWRQEEENLQVNDLVIIKDDRTGPTAWKLGRILELHPGADGMVRVATIYTNSGTYTRSVSKLCRLPIPNYTEAKVEKANIEH
ncbi:uncharacterized protein [Drosophila takahashii]|uniref:uncharacterized protein n=1 Tax=Drosophila takahashii TaxID=29030 RepID=UPI0038996B4C